jgi:hypothetical protein
MRNGSAIQTRDLTCLHPEPEGLVDLFGESDTVAATFGSDWTELPWVGGGGLAKRPDIALIFINPTRRNQSARERWANTRAPFIGLSRIWRVLAKSRIVSSSLIGTLPPDGTWSPEYASDFYRLIAADRVYVTNLVKACRTDATLPSLRQAKAFRPLLIQELSLVRPKLIIGMGALVSTVLSGTALSLESHYRSFRATGILRTESVPDLSQSMVPCYFPVGRGNPARASEILTHPRSASS